MLLCSFALYPQACNTHIPTHTHTPYTHLGQTQSWPYLLAIASEVSWLHHAHGWVATGSFFMIGYILKTSILESLMKIKNSKA